MGNTNRNTLHPDERTIKQIRERLELHSSLEGKLMKAGPAWAEKIMWEQTKIEEYYVADVSELLETMENAVYQLEQLEPLLNIPEQGYVRNNFRRVINTLKNG